MKKVLALLLTLAMAACMFACQGSDAGKTEAPAAGDAAKTIKVGMVSIGDENDQGYSYNFMRGTEKAKEALAAEGINVEWIVKFNIGESDACTDACVELAEEGCDLIICNSFGHEDFMLKAAPDYPDVQFVSCTNSNSRNSDLSNVHNAFANIYEARYVAGIAAGMKLQQMIDEGTITADQAVIGYVGAYSYAEVISGYTAFYLGARSVCASATMKVKYVNSWSDAEAEGQAAQALCAEGCVLISQHADNTTEATAAEANGAFHVGYNNDMSTIAPQASLISSRIDWSVYFEYAIRCVVNGEEISKDWTGGFEVGAVTLTALNEAIAAPGTQEKMDAAIAAISAGTLHVFDTATFTVNGETITSQMALDTNGDWVPDSGEAVYDGYFHESDIAFQSAPYFALIIDGITQE